MATVNMSQFNSQGVTRNILETGEVELVIAEMQRLPNDRKAEVLLDCLSQSLHLQGKYAGKCIGVLTAELLNVVNLSPAAARTAINSPAYKCDPSFRDIIGRVHALVQTVLPINIYNIRTVDILDEGRTDMAIEAIMGNDQAANGVKIQALFGCLLQVLNGTGNFAEKCAADLKKKIYDIARSEASSMRTFLQNDQVFKYESKLAQVIQTASQLANKGREIDLRHFSDGSQTEADITKTGNIKLVIDYIIQHVEPLPVAQAAQVPNANQAKIEALLNCLSQARALEGPFQGGIESELKAAVFQLARLHPADARIALRGARFVHDEKLKAVYKFINLAIEDYQHIDMQNFLTQDGWIDILDTGRIELVVQHIAQAGNNQPRQLMMALLNCLSQTLSLGGRNQGRCESVLKSAIYAKTKETPDHALDVLQLDEYKHDKKLEDVIKQMEYLSTPLFNRLYLGRLSYHLQDNYFNNKAMAVTYTVAGAVLLTYNGFQTVFSSTASFTQKAEGWGIIGSGTALVLAPVGNAIYHAYKDKKYL